MPSPLHVVLLALVPAAGLLLSAGCIAAFGRPSALIRSGTEHVAAGAILGAGLVEVFPQALSSHELGPLAAGFAAGAVLMVATRSLSERFGSGSAPITLIAVIGVDILLDGILLAITSGIGTRAALLIAAALTIEAAATGLAVAAALGAAALAREAQIAVTGGLAALLLVGAALGGWYATGLHGAMQTALLGGAGAVLIVLSSEELLKEAHEVPETSLLTSLFMASVLAMMVLQTVLG